MCSTTHTVCIVPTKYAMRVLIKLVYISTVVHIMTLTRKIKKVVQSKDKTKKKKKMKNGLNVRNSKYFRRWLIAYKYVMKSREKEKEPDDLHGDKMIMISNI